MGFSQDSLLTNMLSGEPVPTDSIDWYLELAESLKKERDKENMEKLGIP